MPANRPSFQDHFIGTPSFRESREDPGWPGGRLQAIAWSAPYSRLWRQGAKIAYAGWHGGSMRVRISVVSDARRTKATTGAGGGPITGIVVAGAQVLAVLSTGVLGDQANAVVGDASIPQRAN